MVELELRQEPFVYRFRVFVDFWNFTLSMKEIDADFRTDWKILPRVLIREAMGLISDTANSEYLGMHVYASYSDGGDSGFINWARNVLDTFPGVTVTIVPRQKKRTAPKCPACHTEMRRCGSCSADMRGTEEKGIDTRIAIDMVSLAWEKAYDVGILVSSDKDFLPVVEYLQPKGVRIIHAAFPPSGAALTQKCWGSIPLPQLRKNFQR